MIETQSTHLDEARTRFISEYPAYDQQTIANLRHRSFARLDQQKHVYLDYTGGSLYSQDQLDAHQAYLASNILGNPHSTNPSSMQSTLEVEAARNKVISYFNAQDYVCVFTPNATGALKIIGESYPFTQKSHFLLPFDNHNSVNGIREYAKNKGADHTYVPIQIEDLRFQADVLTRELSRHQTSDFRLFAYPAQSNVSGVQHDLDWITFAQVKGWDVLLDASAYVPTNVLDLEKHQPEFVSMSFYKMFGFPTGLGALLIRKDKLEILKKPWFAGGTVTLASVMAEEFFLEQSHARFEDGTINYLDIPAIKTGLDFIESIGIHSIHERVKALSSYLLNTFTEIRHRNGSPLVQIFGPQDCNKRGGTFILNVFDSDGTPVPFYTIEKLANEHNFSIRTGCFCNPGIDEINNHLDENTLRSYFETRSKGDYLDMQAYLHQLRGAIRISLGIASNFEDVFRFEQFLRTLSK